MTLLFQIQPNSGVPIYRQIIEQVKRLTVSGYLKAGDGLPSVRQVAGYLQVNPMTVSKAYSLLEAAGVLKRVRGKGMIVASNQQSADSLEARLELIRPALAEAATQAKQLALPKESVLKSFARLLEGQDD